MVDLHLSLPTNVLSGDADSGMIPIRTHTRTHTQCLPIPSPERTFAVFRHSPMNTRAHYLGNGSQAKDSDPRRRISQDADSPGKLCFPLPPHSRFCQSETRRSSHGKKTPSRNCKLCSLIRRPSGIQFEQHSILDGLKYPGVPGSENDDPVEYEREPTGPTTTK
ncbi:hypothetical protein BDP67DRAFT_19909 [Colletotrichum lupini]|nr:hypothetical protein BDP67DRAFT_19909 [Colletotrichum lupini]